MGVGQAQLESGVFVAQDVGGGGDERAQNRGESGEPNAARAQADMGGELGGCGVDASKDIGGAAAEAWGRTLLAGACGLSGHAPAPALGIAALVATSAAGYTTLKFDGVGYVIFLALRMRSTAGAALDQSDEKDRTGPRRPFAQGLL